MGNEVPPCCELSSLRRVGACVLKCSSRWDCAIRVLSCDCSECAPARSSGWLCAGCYYACAAWSLIPAARNFFGPNVGLPEALGWWLATAALLSLPWAWAWTSKPNHRWWRCHRRPSLYRRASSGSDWLGFASDRLWIPVSRHFMVRHPRVLSAEWQGFPVTPRLTLAAVVSVSTFANAVYTAPRPLPWKGINTRFGAGLATAHDRSQRTCRSRRHPATRE